MKVVSLDQNFLWNFATGQLAGFAKLHAALRQAVAEGQAICPIHYDETIFEASLVDPNLQEAILQIAEELSHGYAFHSFGVTLGFDSLRLVRPSFAPPLFQQPGPLPRTEASTGAKNRALKQDYERRLEEVPYPPASYAPGSKIHEIEEALVAERAGFMFRMAEALASKGSLETGKKRWEYTDVAGMVLLEYGITKEESQRLREAVIQRKWDSLDVLHVHSRLCALLESDGIRCGREYDANDAWDLSRLAVGLTQADVVCCDRAMGALIERSKLLHPERGSAVFTSKQLDEAVTFFESLT